MNYCEPFSCFPNFHVTRKIFGGFSMNKLLFFIGTTFALNLKLTKILPFFIPSKQRFSKGK